MDFRTDVVIVGTGVAGTFSALNLPIPSDFPLPPNRRYKAVLYLTRYRSLLRFSIIYPYI